MLFYCLLYLLLLLLLICLCDDELTPVQLKSFEFIFIYHLIVNFIFAIILIILFYYWTDTFFIFPSFIIFTCEITINIWYWPLYTEILIFACKYLNKQQQQQKGKSISACPYFWKRIYFISSHDHSNYYLFKDYLYYNTLNK